MFSASSSGCDVGPGDSRGTRVEEVAAVGTAARILSFVFKVGAARAEVLSCGAGRPRFSLRAVTEIATPMAVKPTSVTDTTVRRVLFASADPSRRPRSSPNMDGALCSLCASVEPETPAIVAASDPTN